MRTLLVASKYMADIKSRNPGEFALDLKAVADILPKVTPFVFMDDGETSFTEYHDVPENKLFYLPFKYVSTEFLTPMLVEYDLIGWQKQLNMKRPAAIGQIFMEMDDLSIRRVFIYCDLEYNKDSFFKDRLTSIPVGPVRAHIQDYPSYKEFNEEHSCRFTMWLLGDKKTMLGMSDGIHVKKRSLHPDFVKRAVFVSRKRYNNPPKLLGQKIEWLHSWSVCGHWRNIFPNSIGRNREGVYCMIGRTWVKPHVRGDGPFIKKDRIVESILKGDNRVISKSNSDGELRQGPRA